LGALTRLLRGRLLGRRFFGKGGRASTKTLTTTKAFGLGIGGHHQRTHENREYGHYNISHLNPLT
jgi:hypothetical protein